MPEGGRLTIETQNILLTEEYRGRHDVAQPGHYVLLSITNNGTGMSPEVQSRIFEPIRRHFRPSPRDEVDRGGKEIHDAQCLLRNFVEDLQRGAK